MTHPIPGADSERAAFEAKTLEQFAAATFDKFPSGSYRVSWVQDQWIGWQAARAADKVGANVAADIPTWQERRETWLKMRPDVPEGPGSNDAFIACEIADLRRALAAGAPAETPKPVAVAVELIGVAEQIEQGAGFWHSCSGCHDTEDGHPTGNYSYSNEMRCALGNGCAECGGLGAVWDNNDYSEAAGDFLFAHPAPIAGDVEKDAALRFADEIITVVLTQGADFDGGHLQEMALAHGLLRVEDMAGPCGENCACANDGVEFWPSQCYRKTYLAAMLANSSSGEAG